MSQLATSSSGPVRRKVPLPKLVLIHSPAEPVENGRNRKKFPSSKDCCVKIAVPVLNCEKAGSRRKRVSIRYEFKKNERSTSETFKHDSLVNGPTYFLEISSITRHVSNGDTPLLELPTHMVCQHHPLNYYTVSDIQPGHYGFWFRFFGKPCRFHIVITLKLHKNTPGYVDKVVSTIEVDIRNIASTINSNHSMKRPYSKMRDSTLLSEKGYVANMQKLERLQDQCEWERCISAGDELLSSLEKGKFDIKVCILLEQSKAVCHQGNFLAAKLLVKQALQAIPTKSQNKDLLIARAYIYLSLCHHYDLSLGNAEECLRIAKEKLIDFKPCKDTADLHYNEGQLLLSFLLKIPIPNKGLVAEAKKKLELSISHFQESCDSKNVMIMNKIYSAKLYIAMLLLLANPEIDSIVIAEQLISSMSDVHLCQETKCRLSFVKALVLQHNGANDPATKHAKQALDLANTCGLYVEMHWIVKSLKSLK